MDPYASDPRRQRAVECPSCGAYAPAGTQDRATCTHCGHSWSTNPLAEHVGDPLDALATGALTIDALAPFLHGPPTEAELEKGQQVANKILGR